MTSCPDHQPWTRLCLQKRPDGRPTKGRITLKTKLKLSFTALTALAALSLGTSVPAAASDYGTTATEVRVAVSCSADGNFGWNVTVIDGSPYAMYDVHANIGWSDNGGGGGGTFGYPYIGQVGVGGAGIGTSSTWYGYPGPGTTYVWVDARVAGIYASDSDTC